jgi:hypothetical protein
VGYHREQSCHHSLSPSRRDKKANSKRQCGKSKEKAVHDIEVQRACCPLLLKSLDAALAEPKAKSEPEKRLSINHLGRHEKQLSRGNRIDSIEERRGWSDEKQAAKKFLLLLYEHCV